jgi:hypothetical protein
MARGASSNAVELIPLFFLIVILAAAYAGTMICPCSPLCLDQEKGVHGSV